MCCEFATNANLIPTLIRRLLDAGVGDATVGVLQDITNQYMPQLDSDLAVMLDMRVLTKTIYELEGDRLESLLVYDKLEGLRALGRSVLASDSGVLPNLDAIIRKNYPIQTGTKFDKHFTGHGLCEGVVTGQQDVASTLYPGTTVKGYTVKYPGDGSFEDLEEDELRPLLRILNIAERQASISGIIPVFTYLEERITGNCQQVYDYSHNYRMYKALRLFDPARACELQMTTADLDAVFTELPQLGKIILPGPFRAALYADFPQYMARAAMFTTSRGSISDFTGDVLKFWKQHRSELNGTWSIAARVVFSISANSAASERVFSIMKRMYGKHSGRDNSLGEQVSTSIKLAYNHRVR